MYTVIKRDGRSAEFNLTRISHAITKAFDATGIPYSPDVINLLSLQVTASWKSAILMKPPACPMWKKCRIWWKRR